MISLVKEKDIIMCHDVGDTVLISPFLFLSNSRNHNICQFKKERLMNNPRHEEYYDYLLWQLLCKYLFLYKEGLLCQ